MSDNTAASELAPRPGRRGRSQWGAKRTVEFADNMLSDHPTPDLFFKKMPYRSHGMPWKLDKRVRRVPDIDTFTNWLGCTPDRIQSYSWADADGFVSWDSSALLTALSAHPSGWIRQEVVSGFDDRSLPWGSCAPAILANRSLDMVPAIRESAQATLGAVFDELLEAEQDPAVPFRLDTPVLLATRTLRSVPRAKVHCAELFAQAEELIGRTQTSDSMGSGLNK